MVIYKYQLDMTLINRIAMPAKSEILTVQTQSGVLCVWVKCNPDNPSVIRNLAIHGTGNRFPEVSGIYINTVQMGSLVWHVFDLGEQ